MPAPSFIAPERTPDPTVELWRNVLAGATLLCSYGSGRGRWWARINQADLDMASPLDDVLGQLYGDWRTALTQFDQDPETFDDWALAHGFDAPVAQYAELTAMWRLIVDRVGVHGPGWVDEAQAWARLLDLPLTVASTPAEWKAAA